MCFSLSLFFSFTPDIFLLLSLPFVSHGRLLAPCSLVTFQQFFLFVLFFCLFCERVGPSKVCFCVVVFDLNLKSWRSCCWALRIIDDILCNLILMHILVRIKWGITHWHLQYSDTFPDCSVRAMSSQNNTQASSSQNRIFHIVSSVNIYNPEYVLLSDCTSLKESRSGLRSCLALPFITCFPLFRGHDY